MILVVDKHLSRIWFIICTCKYSMSVRIFGGIGPSWFLVVWDGTTGCYGWWPETCLYIPKLRSVSTLQTSKRGSNQETEEVDLTRSSWNTHLDSDIQLHLFKTTCLLHCLPSPKWHGVQEVKPTRYQLCFVLVFAIFRGFVSRTWRCGYFLFTLGRGQPWGVSKSCCYVPNNAVL